MIAQLAKGHSITAVADRLDAAVSTVSKVANRFQRMGIEGLRDFRAENGDEKVDDLFLDHLRSVLRKTPLDFGWTRPTWTRELLCLQLADDGFPRVAACTMGRALAQLGARRGRPKPIVSCPWPAKKREAQLARLRRLAKRDADDEPVFYADEIDIHLNPKIGSDWMLPGHQRLVMTPGQNRKRYIAGAMRAGSRRVTWVAGESKSSALFCSLVWRLLSETKARRIHLILDNFIIHSSKKTAAFLSQFGDRVVLHFLPPYCPDANRIERLWLDVHANVTRNHRCRTIEEVVANVHAFLKHHNRSTRSRSEHRGARPLRESRSVI